MSNIIKPILNQILSSPIGQPSDGDPVLDVISTGIIIDPFLEPTFQDAAQTIIAGTNDPVGGMVNPVGGDGSATTTRPTKMVDGNGTYLFHNGNADLRHLTFPQVFATTPLTLVIACSDKFGPSTGQYLFSNIATDEGVGANWDTGDKFRLRNDGFSVASSLTMPNPRTAEVFLIEFNGPSSRVRRNGGTFANVNLSIQFDTEGIKTGVQYDNTNASFMYLYWLGMVAGILSDADKTILETRAAERCGVTL